MISLLIILFIYECLCLLKEKMTREHKRHMVKTVCVNGHSIIYLILKLSALITKGIYAMEYAMLGIIILEYIYNNY
jgi:hypothetical protein